VKARGEARLWLLQRASAAVLALCVVVHLATIIAAMRQGLSAGAILARTHGSVAWAAFYGIFVLAVAIHAPIGVRNIAGEWLAWRGRAADAVFVLFGIALLALGSFAIAAVIR
jgi:fumarate reductase subunit C